MLTAINNRNPEHNARDWTVTFLCRVGFPTSNVLQRKRGESKPKPLWKPFDDTHHWDSTAEEWVPHDPT
jgi:hypothetical protein